MFSSTGSCMLLALLGAMAVPSVDPVPSSWVVWGAVDAPPPTRQHWNKSGKIIKGSKFRLNLNLKR